VLLPLGTLARQFTAQSLSQGQQFWSDKVKAQKRALLGLKSFAPTPRAMQLFSAEPHVQAVGLCDSRAMGRHRQSSDVDACIEASEMSHQGRLHPELSTDLEQHLQRVGQCIWKRASPTTHGMAEESPVEPGSSLAGFGTEWSVSAWLLRFSPSAALDPRSTQQAIHSIGAGCGRCLRGGIGTEQQGIQPGFELGETIVLDLEQLQALLALASTQLELLRPLLDVVDGTPVEHRQQAPPRRQRGDPLRS
jgi:hypothetical protein